MFRHRIKRATDASWHALCSQEYAKRWWNSVPENDKPSKISEYPGDRKSPFGSIDLSPDDFIAAGPRLKAVYLENVVISVATAFEAYMADIIGRCIRLCPNLLTTSEIQFTVGELVQPDAVADPVGFLSQEIVRKMVRNKSHSKLVNRFGNMIKRDICSANRPDYDNWNKYVLLRNALIHTAGRVTKELSMSFGARFSQIDSPIVLETSDIVSAHKTAYGLANTIDEFAIETVIGDSDADLMAREIFVSEGDCDCSAISQRIYQVLGRKFSKGDVEASIAKQKREQQDPSKEFYVPKEWLCRPHDSLIQNIDVA